MKGLSRGGHPIEYICKPDRNLPASQQTIFLIRPLSGYVVAQLFDGLKRIIKTETETVELETANASFKIALLYGLVGWRNFRDDAGNLIPFDEKDMEANILTLDYPTFAELGGHILSISRLNEVEKKA